MFRLRGGPTPSTSAITSICALEKVAMKPVADMATFVATPALVNDEITPEAVTDTLEAVVLFVALPAAPEAETAAITGTVAALEFDKEPVAVTETTEATGAKVETPTLPDEVTVAVEGAVAVPVNAPADATVPEAEIWAVEAIEPVVKALNESGINFYIDDSDKWELHAIREENKRLHYMIENGLGWEDMKNDVKYPMELKCSITASADGLAKKPY